MENLLLKKLKIKPGFKVKVINAPDHFMAIFGEQTNEITYCFDHTKNTEALLIFAQNKAAMLAALNALKLHINNEIICWILYPKAKSKLASDLNLMKSWDDLTTYSLTPCASAAINEDWTALRIKPIANVQKSGRANNDINTNEFGNFIDMNKKTITLPEDLKSVLENNSSALDFYHRLSYTNRKEYVLWILSAKQEKTRLDRINKTVEKLLTEKKNPSEK